MHFEFKHPEKTFLNLILISLYIHVTCEWAFAEHSYFAWCSWTPLNIDQQIMIHQLQYTKLFLLHWTNWGTLNIKMSQRILEVGLKFKNTESCPTNQYFKLCFKLHNCTSDVTNPSTMGYKLITAHKNSDALKFSCVLFACFVLFHFPCFHWPDWTPMSDCTINFTRYMMQ